MLEPVLKHVRKYFSVFGLCQNFKFSMFSKYFYDFGRTIMENRKFEIWTDPKTEKCLRTHSETGSNMIIVSILPYSRICTKF